METIPKMKLPLLILAGPAGSGTTLCDRLVDENGHPERVVTCTTRLPRRRNRRVDYYFSDDQFDAKVEDEEFNGLRAHLSIRTLKSTIEAKLEDDVDLVMNIDAGELRPCKRPLEISR